MKYTAQKFGCALLKKIEEKPLDIVKISRWCMQIYTQHLREMDDSLSSLLYELATMADDPQFEYNKEQLQVIAEKLIHNDEEVECGVEFECKDVVIIKKTAPKEYRPGERGVICWIEPNKENSLNCFVKFSSGEIIEIPSEFLIVFDKENDSR